MSRLRASRRAATLVARTCACILGLGFRRLLAPIRGPLSAAELDGWIQRWARGAARDAALTIRVEGEVPRGPVALVSNHLGYFDIVAFWSLLPGAFVARADVAHWPLVGLGGRLIETVFLDRTRKRDLLRVLPQMQAALRADRAVIFFPEGTSTRGDDILPFKSSLFAAAVREDAPVVACSLQYATPDGAPTADWSVCWWGDMTFLPHVWGLLQLPRIEAHLRFSPIETERHAEPALAGPSPLYGRTANAPMEGREVDIAARSETGTDWIPSIREEAAFAARSRAQEDRRKRKELCRLAYEAIQKKFIPTTPAESCPTAREKLATAKEAPRSPLPVNGVLS